MRVRVGMGITVETVTSRVFRIYDSKITQNKALSLPVLNLTSSSYVEKDNNKP